MTVNGNHCLVGTVAGCGVNALSGLRGAFVGLIRRGKRRIRHWRGQTSTSLILRVQHIVHIHAGAEFKSISDRVVMQPSDMPLF